ncbi:MAG: DUF3467 domain-containing protein [Candidatus Zophobacter franzmannii]|jgi:hypothetical protein|nr:DUF3467 domain-containing protein [Candidatus Zophobacter franzmannii]
MKEQKKQLNVKIDEKIGEGTYSNFFMITNSPAEYILDFGILMPGLPSAKIVSRILTTPQHAKQMMLNLQKNIEAYEKLNGEIKVQGQTEHNKQIGFTKN